MYDQDFLRELDHYPHHHTYAKIVALDQREYPIEEITGRVTAGSINIDGSSSVRRTCSLTLVANDVNINDYYWGLKNKFELSIGLENKINDIYIAKKRESLQDNIYIYSKKKENLLNKWLEKLLEQSENGEYIFVSQFIAAIKKVVDDKNKGKDEIIWEPYYNTRQYLSLKDLENKIKKRGFYWIETEKEQALLELERILKELKDGEIFDSVEYENYKEKVKNTYKEVVQIKSELNNVKFVLNNLQYNFEHAEKIYAQPDIIWFKQGVFVISSFSNSVSANQYTISLQGKDKMSFLNGDMGGVIPATWDFGTIEDVVTNSEGETIYENGGYAMTEISKIPVKDIILQAVHEFAQETWQNIIINDLDDYGIELLEYQGNVPLYLLIPYTGNLGSFSAVEDNAQLTKDATQKIWVRLDTWDRDNKKRIIGPWAKKEISQIGRIIAETIENSDEPEVTEAVDRLKETFDKLNKFTKDFLELQQAKYGDFIKNYENTINIWNSDSIISNDLKEIITEYKIDIEKCVEQFNNGTITSEQYEEAINLLNEEFNRQKEILSNSEFIEIMNNYKVIAEEYEPNEETEETLQDYTFIDTDLIHLSYERFLNEINLSTAAIDSEGYLRAVCCIVDEDETDLDEDSIEFQNYLNSIPDKYFTVAEITRNNGLQTCGYRITDIVYPSDLIASPGETVTSILDKLVKMLGNFEYFYDVDGRFIFQKKRTFTDVSYNNIANEHSFNPEVWADSAMFSSKYSYTFDHNVLLSSIQNSPNFGNIKNDFSLWGERNSGSGNSIPIHMRYAIDKKPWAYKTFDREINGTIVPGVWYMTEEGKQRYDELTGNKKYHYENENVQEVWKDVFWDLRKDYPAGMDQGTLLDWWKFEDWIYLYRKYINENIPTDVYMSYSRNNQQKTILDSYYYDNWGNLKSVFSCHYNLSDNTRFNVIDTNSENITEVVYTGHGATCSHYYTSLLKDNESHEYLTWVYDPRLWDQSKIRKESSSIYNEVSIQDEVKTKISDDNIKVVDWREIIFRMANDYRMYYRTNEKLEKLTYKSDEFLIDLKENNRLTDTLFLYPTGITGYEQYYIDFEMNSNTGVVSYWRELYNPEIRVKQVITNSAIKYEDLNSFYIVTHNQLIAKNWDYFEQKLETTGETAFTASMAEAFVKEYGKICLSYIDTFINGVIEAYGVYSATSDSPTLEDIQEKRVEFSNTFETLYSTLKTEKEKEDESADKIVSSISTGSYDVKGNFLYDVLIPLYDENTKYNIGEKVRIVKDGYYAIYKSNWDNNSYNPLDYEVDSSTGSLYWTKCPTAYSYDSDGWNLQIKNNPEVINFWFDFLDANDNKIDKYSVHNIGLRSKATNDTKIKSIYFREIPNIIFQTNAEMANSEKTVSKQYSTKNGLHYVKPGYAYLQLDETTANAFNISARGKSCFDTVDEYLYNYTYCNASVSLNSVPIYYLTPNTLIYINDPITGIVGEYVMTRYSIQLGLNATMSISANETIKRIY